MRKLIDDLVNKWILELPNAVTAYRQDALFHYQVEWIRTMMIVLDELLDEHGVISRTRLEVFKKLVVAGPDANMALRRMAEHEHTVNQLMRQTHPQYRPPWQET